MFSDIREKILWWAARRRVLIDKPFIIAVTGSIAKTSTKVAVGAVLRRAFPNQVRVGFGNLNSFLGVPLAILNFEVDFYKKKIGLLRWTWLLKLAIWRGLFSKLPRYLVLEYGADYPGDIEALAKMLPLDIAIITLTGPAHLANYSSLEAIATEKAKILTAVKKGGWGLVNESDPYLQYFTEKDCPSEMVATETEDIALNFARAVGQKLKLDDKIIDEALAVLPRPVGRLQLKDLGAIKLLDDSYNANPLSMKAAFSVLAKLPDRKVAILGDMLELGVEAKKFHREIGQLASQNADIVIGVGELSKEYNGKYWYPDSAVAAKELFLDQREIINPSVGRENTTPPDKKSNSVSRVFSVLREGDTVLVKGSHGIQMEKIVEAIEHHFKKQ